MAAASSWSVALVVMALLGPAAPTLRAAPWYHRAHAGGQAVVVAARWPAASGAGLMPASGSSRAATRARRPSTACTASRTRCCCSRWSGAATLLVLGSPRAGGDDPAHVPQHHAHPWRRHRSRSDRRRPPHPQGRRRVDRMGPTRRRHRRVRAPRHVVAQGAARLGQPQPGRAQGTGDDAHRAKASRASTSGCARRSISTRTCGRSRTCRA